MHLVVLDQADAALVGQLQLALAVAGHDRAVGLEHVHERHPDRVTRAGADELAEGDRVTFVPAPDRAVALEVLEDASGIPGRPQRSWTTPCGIGGRRGRGGLQSQSHPRLWGIPSRAVRAVAPPPFVFEEGVDEQRRPFALEPFALHQTGLAAEAEPFHDPGRCRVALVDARHDAVQAHAVEAQREERVDGLGRIATAAGARVEDVPTSPDRSLSLRQNSTTSPRSAPDERSSTARETASPSFAKRGFDQVVAMRCSTSASSSGA